MTRPDVKSDKQKTLNPKTKKKKMKELMGMIDKRIEGFKEIRFFWANQRKI